jgi:hypothetical protein
MVKTDKKAVKKTAKKTTAKKAVKKTTTKKTPAKKRATKTKVVADYMSYDYMQGFLKSMMPEMVGQLGAGVLRDRMVEIVSFNKGQINFGSGEAEFKFGGKNYSVKEIDGIWKV